MIAYPVGNRFLRAVLIATIVVTNLQDGTFSLFFPGYFYGVVAAIAIPLSVGIIPP